MLYQTTRASFLAQEKNSSLGLIWHLLNPILMTAVLFLVFSQLDRLRDIEHYHLFILVGLIHFNFFINATTRSSSYFIASRSLILNTTVPLELLVLRQNLYRRRYLDRGSDPGAHHRSDLGYRFQRLVIALSGSVSEHTPAQPRRLPAIVRADRIPD